ncbi:hypothetical protein INS49_015055 [Diaporthe citri]|uniref:uncharacterized protein n=1 Tax=Diaporthe citri TaxID=83186 RepID=UPI001C7EDCF2|nr:uncharacterized protein INS49_015055 [Diaporthe citri]KAG6357177.1 hypothetical protein INS49_015055 [Diaporthe citri]
MPPPSPLTPKTPGYILDVLNNSKLSEDKKLVLENLSAAAEEALQNVSHFIVLDGEEDLPIDCLDCLQRAIWGTGAFAAGWRARQPRDATIEEYDGADPTRHTRVRRGGPQFLANEPVIDWISLFKCTTIVITPRLKKSYQGAKAG